MRRHAKTHADWPSPPLPEFVDKPWPPSKHAPIDCRDIGQSKQPSDPTAVVVAVVVDLGQLQGIVAVDNLAPVDIVVADIAADTAAALETDIVAGLADTAVVVAVDIVAPVGMVAG